MFRSYFHFLYFQPLLLYWFYSLMGLLHFHASFHDTYSNISVQCTSVDKLLLNVDLGFNFQSIYYLPPVTQNLTFTSDVISCFSSFLTLSAFKVSVIKPYIWNQFPFLLKQFFMKDFPCLFLGIFFQCSLCFLFIQFLIWLHTSDFNNPIVTSLTIYVINEPLIIVFVSWDSGVAWYPI